MKPARPILVTHEDARSFPILIIDKKGFVGAELAEKLKEQFLIVLVSGRALEFHNNIVHVPYRKKIPTIPDNFYSHIFVVYNGEEELLEMLSSLLKKANDSRGKVFFLTSLLHSSPLLFKRFLHHSYHSMKVILYGEVFDQNISSPNMVNLFIHQSRNYKRLVIPNEGVGKLYPIFLDDLLIVIIAAAFSREAKGGNLFVFPAHPFTEITVARIFQKINPDLKIDFNLRRVRNFNYFIPKEGDFAFTNYNLEIGLKKINLSSSAAALPERTKSVSFPGPRFSLRPRVILVILLTFFLLPLLLILLTSSIGAALVSGAVKEAESGKFQAASQLGTYGSFAFGGAEAIAESFMPAEIFAKGHKDKFVKTMQAGKQVGEIESDLFRAFNVFSNIYKNQATDPKKDFVRELAVVKNDLLILQEMKAQKQLPEVLQAKLDSSGYMISILENTIETYPKILGFEEKRQYLLLFQNNMELRPGGGFIGSYAVLGIDKGRIEKFEIHDVYDADGKLKVHVEPPFGLRRFGGVSHWFLRDSNFDVDFTTNAAASSDILQRATGEKVDGVIAIDTNFIKNILAVLGNVNVIDYKEQVNSSNFYLLTQKHAEDNFFAGSTQKKDFLRSLLNSMLVTFGEKKDLSFLTLSRQIEKSIKEKHLMFAFADSAIQKTFTLNSLSGAIVDNRLKEDNMLEDYFGTSDANIGANKDNFYLKRAIRQNVSITESGGVDETATITYENTSTKTSPFGGDYKNYLRFILPNGANLKSVNIDGRETQITEAITNPSLYGKPSFVPPQQLEIESSEVSGKQVVAFFLIVPIQSTKKISIAYTIAQSVNTASPAFAYDLRFFKQPGTDSDPYSLTLVYPAKFKPVGLTSGYVDLGGQLKYETVLNEDKEIKIQFSQK